MILVLVVVGREMDEIASACELPVRDIPGCVVGRIKGVDAGRGGGGSIQETHIDGPSHDESDP